MAGGRRNRFAVEIAVRESASFYGASFYSFTAFTASF